MGRGEWPYTLTPLSLILMFDPSTLNEPIYFDEKGGYITESQLRFFINRIAGRHQFMSGGKEFAEYFVTCRTYNIISDLMRKDPDCASMYWDEKREMPAFSFPVGGKVIKKFNEMGIVTVKDEPGDYYELL